MNDIIWIDTETTGTDPRESGIVQLAAAIEHEGTIIETFHSYANPGAVLYDPKAMEINGLTMAQVEEAPLIERVLWRFADFMGKHHNRYAKDLRYVPAGWNVAFDLEFIKAAFDQYFDKFEFWKHLQMGLKLDGMPYAQAMRALGRLPVQNCTLESVAAHYGIQFKAHDAMADALAAREVIKKLINFKAS